MTEPITTEWTPEQVQQAYAHGDYEAIVEARKAGHLDHLLTSEQ